MTIQTTFPSLALALPPAGWRRSRNCFSHLPLDTGMGFVLVQHLDPQHESALTQLLTG
ncbi:MAG TPA: hypothetical protein VGK65_15885 [Candidatus Binatia bacterium]